MTQVDTQPVPVTITNHPQPKTFEKRSAFHTAVLTAANPTAQIAAYDPLRLCIRFNGSPNAYVICGSGSQAGDASNLVAVPVNPNGRLIPANAISTEFVTEGQNEVWVSGGTYPTLIGYEIVRKVPEGA